MKNGKLWKNLLEFVESGNIWLQSVTNCKFCQKFEKWQNFQNFEKYITA